MEFSSPLSSHEFLSHFQNLTKLLEQETRKLLDISASTHDYLTELYNYNVPHGKLIRGLMTVHCYQSLVNKATKPDIEKAAALGWCVEWLQASYLVLDDIMDHSLTRRGRPCWYKLPKIGLAAVNDGLILEGAPVRILRHYFSDKPRLYLKLRHIFDEISYKTQIGQLLDITTSDRDFDINNLSKERYDQIVKLKTAYYTFYLPFYCAIVCSEIELQAGELESVESLALLFGYYFQVQDDFLDCFGDPNVTGKIGTDIQDNKCSWLAVTFLESASEEEKTIFQNNYGRNEEAKIEVIKELYQKNCLKEKFSEFENTLFSQCTQTIASIPYPNLRSFFDSILSTLYKRQK